MGYGPITHTEITSWADGMRYFISPFERQAICAVDKAFLIHHSKEK